MANPIVHFEIAATDGDMMRSFYGNMFDWHIDHMPDMHYSLINTHVDGAVGVGIAPAEFGAKGVTVYVPVPDIQGALGKAEGLGGRTVMPPTDIPGAVSMAKIADPEGDVISLIKG